MTQEEYLKKWRGGISREEALRETWDGDEEIMSAYENMVKLGWEMKEMNVIDDLISLDKSQLTNIQTTEVEIERLSELIKKPCLFKIQGLTNKQVKELEEFHTKYEWEDTMVKGKLTRKKVKKVDAYKLGLEMIVEATVDPDFRDSRLREKFKTENPADIVEEMLTPGEVAKIANVIRELIGVDTNEQSDVDEEIKNS
ncbi:MAG: hypothetical protein IKN12_12965 [Selenomonadaceae bacterium]|nr:hypothetical protein [Selenomonadaceae bacterium]